MLVIGEGMCVNYPGELWMDVIVRKVLWTDAIIQQNYERTAVDRVLHGPNKLSADLVSGLVSLSLKFPCWPSSSSGFVLADAELC